MPANDVMLPSDPVLLARVVNKHFDRERERLMPQIALMRLAAEYLAGVRRFDVLNLRTGEVRGAYVDKDGALEYIGSDFLKAVDEVVGHMGSYDLRNRVVGSGYNLSAVRETALGQVISDSVFADEDVDNAGQDFLNIFALMGSCGITCKVEGNPANGVGMTADIEVIHPMELVPFPSLDHDMSKQRGIGREYYCSMDDLKNKIGSRKLNKIKDDLHWFEVETGENPKRGEMSESPIGDWRTESGTGGMPGDEREGTTGFVRLREIWLNGTRGTCSRKVCVSGDAVVQDLDFEGLEVYSPIGYARFMNNGTFHGAGLFHMLYSLARNLEKAMKSAFNETNDLERFGCLLIPQGDFNVNQVVKEVVKGLKTIPWEPDPFSNSGQRPIHIPPFNTNERHAKTAVMGKQYFDAINPLQNIIKEKGRVDSERGLAFLQEQASRAMTSPTRGVIRAFGQMYKSGLAQAAKVLTEDRTALLPVTRLSLDLAGAVIDWEKNAVSFGTNPLPSISRITCVPRLAESRSKAQRKVEAVELLKVGIGDPIKFVIQGIKEDWDIPMDFQGEQSAVMSITKDILTLYGDGETPGMVVANIHFARPLVQLSIFDGFLGSPKMREASEEVKTQFIRYRKMLIEQSGRALPEGLPFNPDDLAVASMGQQQQPMPVGV